MTGAISAASTFGLSVFWIELFVIAVIIILFVSYLIRKTREAHAAGKKNLIK